MHWPYHDEIMSFHPELVVPSNHEFGHVAGARGNVRTTVVVQHFEFERLEKREEKRAVCRREDGRVALNKKPPSRDRDRFGVFSLSDGDPAPQNRCLILRFTNHGTILTMCNKVLCDWKAKESSADCPFLVVNPQFNHESEEIGFPTRKNSGLFLWIFQTISGELCSEFRATTIKFVQYLHVYQCYRAIFLRISTKSVIQGVG